VTYHIEEGPQTRVRKVLVSGYVHTRPGVIRRLIQVKRMRRCGRARWWIRSDGSITWELSTGDGSAAESGGIESG